VRAAKRILDLVVAVPVLLLISPALVLISGAILATMRSPILFRQRRAGYRGRQFTLYKFRTMTDARGLFGELLPDASRLTGIGRFLRKTSLDEVPQLWNVILGSMSLVGPRPLLSSYLPRYSAFQARRHEVKPGITGWAQVRGRNDLTWERKFELDVWYVDHQSFWLDVRILWLTLAAVLRRDGISQEGCATMPVFDPKSRPGA